MAPLSTWGFGLYGGTVIALRLGHRPSVDFDFFTQKRLDTHALHASLPFLDGASLLQSGADTLTYNVPDVESDEAFVKLSFFGAIGFGHYAAPDTTLGGVLRVASLDDLLATKLKVILQRFKAKDYQDIAAMLKAGVDLSLGLAIAEAMFGSAFAPSESLKALTWFDGGDLQRLTDNGKRLLVEAASAGRRLPSIEMQKDELVG